MANEENFRSEEERLRAFAAYFGLTSFLDHNVGQILSALREYGLEEDTHAIYTSDHGDNVGARGLWGKSTLYQESVGVPMIMAGPSVHPGVCDTPVDLLDLFPTILEGAGVDLRLKCENAPDARFSMSRALRAIQSVSSSASTTLRAATRPPSCCARGAGSTTTTCASALELFDLETDSEEENGLAEDSRYADVLREMQRFEESAIRRRSMRSRSLTSRR
jgi:choline-sulfatase